MSEIQPEKIPEEVAEASRELSLPIERSSALFDVFRKPYENAAELLVKEPATTEPAEARRLRLDMVKARTAISKAKTSAKSDILLAGRAIDWFHNRGVAQLSEAERRLEEIEKAEERRIAEIKRKLKQERIEKLAKFDVDGSFYQLDEMPEDQFDALFARSKLAHQAELEAKKVAEEKARIEAERIEAERIAREKAEAEERARIAAENAKLKAEAEAREKEIQAERKRVAAEDAKREAERKHLEQIAARERAERERIEAEAKKAREAEAERQRKIDEQKRKSEAAPDREKLAEYAKSIRDVSFPKMASEAGENALIEIQTSVGKMIAWINLKADSLTK